MEKYLVFCKIKWNARILIDFGAPLGGATHTSAHSVDTECTLLGKKDSREDSWEQSKEDVGGGFFAKDSAEDSGVDSGVDSGEDSKSNDLVWFLSILINT